MCDSNDSITALIERLHAEANALGEEWPNEAADVLAKLRDALETYIKLNSGGHVHIDDLKKARAALGWK